MEDNTPFPDWVGNKGWLDDAEEAALLSIAPLVRSKRILDIGVGTGRTVPLMALLTDEYVGVDVSSEMVAACRRNYPNKDIRRVDARDLSEFQDRSFDFVLFSFNGIDNICEDHERKGVFREVHRVLDSDGLFLFCSLNKDGCVYAESPLQTHRPGKAADRSVKAALHLAEKTVRDPLRLPRRYRNWRKTKPQTLDVDGWGTSALASSDFTHIVYFTTLSRLREEVSDAGFEILQTIGSDDGRPIAVETPATSDNFLHVLARKSAPANA
ncbi:MAG TPA: class I SAM-dependent methyltransferase [Acidimicrobiales bacterium]|jgi:ubiquinone/menaquinone biosynthesis C-methylase UbiE|nr:class I SAM-dependent methyltransferase [Acidimicrobiales bacterium]